MALTGRPHRRLRPKPNKCPPAPLTPRHAAQPYLSNLCLLRALMSRSSKQAPPSPGPAPFVALVSRCRFPHQRLLAPRVASSAAEPPGPVRTSGQGAPLSPCGGCQLQPPTRLTSRKGLAAGALSSVGRLGVPPHREPRPESTAPQAGRSEANKRPG
ncbi:hypothetical protein NDU88_002969 [Pleurodeles waltl]|uniref:Uncharacterized protein n=1 Tax=Pleurodeles waltl TaxID=8319 RepID=A0AAV7KXM3_PLEWA|nr:hypothetical protein NDU88_002969 [Pleurodeles waltl]